MQIKEENNRFALYNDENQEIGEMTWSDAGESMMIIDHTFVDPTYRGQKLAEKLVLAGVEKARKEHKKTEKEKKHKKGAHTPTQKEGGYKKEI